MSTFPCAGFYMRENSSIKEEDMGYVEPEQLNLVVLKAATNNFSEENKLGEGGFGQVFKVHVHLNLYNSTHSSHPNYYYLLLL